jgi:hypothetical protein
MKRILLVLLLIFFSCSKDDSEEISTLNQVETIQYSLTVNPSTNGRISISGGPYSYDSQTKLIYKGQQVTLTTFPDEGYKFDSWSNGQTDEEITVTLNSDIDISANFVELQVFSLSINDVDGGLITIKKGNNFVSPGEFYEGTQLTIDAVVDEGYLFQGWEGLDSNSQSLTITLDSDIIVSLNLTPLAFDVNNMEIIKYHLYHRDTLDGKKINDLRYHHYDYDSTRDWNISSFDIENNLDFLVSENFIVWWDKSLDRYEMAVDILRWSEFSVIKALESGYDKPKDFETHRINIFINQKEGNVNVLPNTSTNFVQKAMFNRKFVSYLDKSDFEIIRSYTNTPVLHEMFHVFQNNYNSKGPFGWYTEATAEYFEQKFFLPKNGYKASYQFTDFLLSTNRAVWDNRSDVYHRYGLSLLFLYLDWNNFIDLPFIAQSYRDSYGDNLNGAENGLEYLIRKIPNFRDVYFEFALKTSVLDFNYRDKILYRLNPGILRYKTLEESGFKRFELELKDSGTEGFYTPTKQMYGWGFSIYKVESSNNSTFSFEFESSNNEFRFGLVKEQNGNYSYSEVSEGEEFNFQINSNNYLIILNQTDEIGLWVGGENWYKQYDYKIKINKIN